MQQVMWPQSVANNDKIFSKPTNHIFLTMIMQPMITKHFWKREIMLNLNSNLLIGQV